MSTQAAAVTVAQQKKDALTQFEGQLKKMLPRIGELLPRRAGDPHRFVRMVMMACVRTPNLLNADRNTLLLAVMNAAELGLSCSGGPASRAHLVPFKGKVTCIPDFKGLIDIALDSGKVDSIEAETVHQGDEFEYRRGTDPILKHVPKLTERGEMIAVYAVAWPHGAVRPVWVVMSRAEVEGIRDNSPAYRFAKDKGGDTPWIKSFGEMAKKTAIRRLYKWLPTTAEMQRAEEIDTAADSEDLATLEAIAAEGSQLTEGEKEERLLLLKAIAAKRVQDPDAVVKACIDLGMDDGEAPDHLHLVALRDLANNLGIGGGAPPPANPPAAAGQGSLLDPTAKKGR